MKCDTRQTHLAEVSLQLNHPRLLKFQILPRWTGHGTFSHVCHTVVYMLFIEARAPKNRPQAEVRRVHVFLRKSLIIIYPSSYLSWRFL